MNYIHSQMNSNIKTIISLEGNIGAGKSSFMAILKERLGEQVEFVDEPVDEWISMKNNKGENLLQVFYENKKRWSYTFQNIAYITRMKKIMDIMMNSTKKMIIMDRSLEGDMNTFTKMLKEDGDIDDMEWQAYLKWNKFFSDYIGKNVETKHIYLRCAPDVAYTRIIKRDRNEEATIPIEYIIKLDEYHEKWLLNDDKDQVLILNVDKDFVKNEDNKEVVFKYAYQNMLGKYI